MQGPFIKLFAELVPPLLLTSREGSQIFLVHIEGSIGQEGGKEEFEVSLCPPTLLPAKYIRKCDKDYKQATVYIAYIDVRFPYVRPVFQGHAEPKQQ